MKISIAYSIDTLRKEIKISKTGGLVTTTQKEFIHPVCVHLGPQVSTYAKKNVLKSVNWSEKQY